MFGAAQRTKLVPTCSELSLNLIAVYEIDVYLGSGMLYVSSHLIILGKESFQITGGFHDRENTRFIRVKKE